MSDKEIETVLSSFSGRYATRNRALFVLGIKSGYRISELLSLRILDVVQYGKVLDRITIEAKNMKGKRQGRSVVLHQAAKEAIMAYINEYEKKWQRLPDSDEFLFKSQYGANRPLSRSQVSKFLHDIYNAHAFTGKLGNHVMRKVFARKMWEIFQKDIVKVQAAMGHSNINSTVKYLCNFAQEDIEKGILSA